MDGIADCEKFFRSVLCSDAGATVAGQERGSVASLTVIGCRPSGWRAGS